MVGDKNINNNKEILCGGGSIYNVKALAELCICMLEMLFNFIKCCRIVVQEEKMHILTILWYKEENSKLIFVIYSEMQNVFGNVG